MIAERITVADDVIEAATVFVQIHPTGQIRVAVIASIKLGNLHYTIEPTLEAIKAILPTANPDEYAICVGADMWNTCRAAIPATEGSKE